jgi:probable phosphoglycerate mutase
MFFVLHGQTVWNREGRYQGSRDSALTDEGRAQARAAGIILRDHLPDPAAARIIASPLGRAQATAQIVAGTLGAQMPIATDARLVEAHLGSWEGLTWDEIAARWPDALAGATHHDRYFRSPDGESHDAVAARLQDWLDGLRDHTALVVIGHGLASRILRGLYLGLSKDAALELEIVRGAVFRLQDGRVAKFTAG